MPLRIGEPGPGAITSDQVRHALSFVRVIAALPLYGGRFLTLTLPAALSFGVRNCETRLGPRIVLEAAMMMILKTAYQSRCTFCYEQSGEGGRKGY